MIKIISENNNRCTVNHFIFACSFIYLFFFFFFFFLSKIIYWVTFMWVLFYTGYKLFANTLNLWVWINAKNKCPLKVKVFAVCLLGWKINRAKFVLLVCDTPTWPGICPYQTIIKLFQTVWELRPARCFHIWGDKYIMEKMEITLEHVWPLSMPLPNIIKIIQTIKKLWHI